jgi:hypothetical protein
VAATLLAKFRMKTCRGKKRVVEFDMLDGVRGGRVRERKRRGERGKGSRVGCRNYRIAVRLDI